MQEKSGENQNKIRDIINIGKFLEKGKNKIQEQKDENLYYYFYTKDIYNEKSTKLKNKEKFITLINIINEYIKEGNDFIFLFFKKINIDLIKVIFNGYINFDISDNEQKEFLLGSIKNFISLFLPKNLFSLVYNKLSKIFRRFNLIDDKEILFDKFRKTFDLWKLLYNINNPKKLKENYLALLGNKFLVLLNSKNINNFQFKEVNISIEFDEGIYGLNSINDDFIKIIYHDHGIQAIKYKDIIKEEKKEIKNIFCKINEESINCGYNKENLKEMIKLNSLRNFSQIELLRNYIGKINKIILNVECKNEKLSKYEYEIIPKDSEEGYEIKKYMNEDFIRLYFEPIEEINLISSKIYKDILYEDIRYYGGMECFIPIIKIIKYFLATFREKEDKIKQLSEILIDINKNIFKFICYSKNNFENFKKILIQFLAALAEINHVYPKEMKNDLYSNYIFSLLYIIIISSSIPFSLKKSYMEITGLYNKEKLNMNFGELIIDINTLNISSYNWYTTILIIIIEFILLELNDINKIPKNIINQLFLLKVKVEKLENKDLEQTKNKILSFLNCSIQSLNYILLQDNKENNLFENIPKIEDISEFNKINFINNEDNLKLILIMIKVYINLINLEEEKIENNELIFKKIFENYFKTFAKSSNEITSEIKDLICKTFEDYILNKEFLSKIFLFLDNYNFNLETEIIFSELIDFHSDYHNLMKNLFIFNKFWSDKKLFFNEKKREKYLKYKSINYYTKNYQRPFLSPDLDYKYSYPNFTNFNITKDFYIAEENKDDYNFNLDCPEFDEFNINYEEKILKKIENNSTINYYNICLVKRTHHIKGKLFICFNSNTFLIKKIIFYSYPKTIANLMPCCNASSEKDFNINKKKEKLCNGAIFTCPEKYMNKKLIIEIKDIRMILKKIYFYRKSAVEIYTNNKSYFFNFANKSLKQSEKNCSDFINMFGFEFVDINIKKEIIGYCRQEEVLFKSNYDKEMKYDNSKEENKLIYSLFNHWALYTNVELSTFDLLIYLNILSNRSFIDIFQYPVFPLLFFYDRIKENVYNILDRKLNLHIGFQTVSEKAKTRRNLIKESYNHSYQDYEENEEEEEEVPSYFSTHFSNNFYIANFLIRYFPYSFLAVELQGNGFDSPNRLFFSIEDTFFNISSHKNDLRELIPEFYYFPEMFFNLNKINFKKRTNGELVDNVVIPQDLNKIDKEKNSNNSNSNNENTDYFRTFKFVEKMRNLLESKSIDIISWINIIFGSGQKGKDDEYYFRFKSYINYDDKGFKYDKAYLTSVEFGMTPIQIVFDGDTSKTKHRNALYNLTIKENKELYKTFCKICPGKIKQIKDGNNNDKEENDTKKSPLIKYFKEWHQIKNSNKVSLRKNDNNLIINNIFFDSEMYINYIYKKENIKIIGYKTGKVEVFKSNEDNKFFLISELFDHNDEINHINYNERLNMICTSSKDGFVNVYSFPNKLITTIKNNNKNSFNMVFLSSNPFPAVIVFDEENFDITSYSINGFKIKNINIYNLLDLKKDPKLDLYICSNFNENGGTFKDRLIFIENIKKDNLLKCHCIKVPFFEKEEKTIDIKANV